MFYRVNIRILFQAFLKEGTNTKIKRFKTKGTVQKSFDYAFTSHSLNSAALFLGM